MFNMFYFFSHRAHAATAVRAARAAHAANAALMPADAPLQLLTSPTNIYQFNSLLKFENYDFQIPKLLGNFNFGIWKFQFYSEI